MVLAFSRWYFQIYLISSIAFGGMTLGYASLTSWYYNMSFFDDDKVAGFALIASFAGIVLLWSAFAIARHFETANPSDSQQKIYIVATVLLQAAILIIAIVMLAVLSADDGMAFYIVDIVWATVNIVIGFLSLSRSTSVAKVDRQRFGPPVRQNQQPVENIPNDLIA